MQNVPQTKELVNYVRKVFNSDHFSKFNKSFISGQDHKAPDLIASQNPEGFTAFRDRDNTDSHIMIDSGRSLEVANPEPVRQGDPKYNNSRARRRYKKKSLKLWRNLSSFKNENLEITNKSYTIKCNLSHDVSAVCCHEFREEYYLPFAFIHNDRPVGGAYIHLYEAGTVEQLSKPRKGLPEKRFKEVYTGGCLFGSTLYGIDQYGERHSLTSPYTEIPAGCKVKSIECPFDIHPDEIITRETLVNLLPLIKACSTENVKLRYHLPTANYFIYGINWYLKNKITKKALTSYFSLVIERSKSQKEYLTKLSENHEIDIITSSTLDALKMDASPASAILEDLCARIGVDPENISSENILQASIKYLCENNHESQKVWSCLKHSIDRQLIDVNNDLLVLNYLDYSASLATASQQYACREVLSLLPSHESPVSHSYKKILAGKFGAVTCMQWLSPVQFNIEAFRNRSFYINQYIGDINELINMGLIHKNSLQTAAIALDSPTLALSVSEQISNVLSLQEESVLIREQKTVLAMNSTFPATAI